MVEKIEVSEKVLILQNYIENQKDGAEISYITIEHETGVNMDQRGKQTLRRSIKRAKKEFSTIYNYGIKLASPETALSILSNKIIRIDNSVKRAEKTQLNLKKQFFHQLTAEEKKQILFAGAVFGAIRVAAENGKLIYQKKNYQQKDETKIAIPFILSDNNVGKD